MSWWICFLQTQLFASQDVNLMDWRVWITCGYCDVLSAVWTLILTAPFTAEEPLVSKWHVTLNFFKYFTTTNGMKHCQNQVHDWIFHFEVLRNVQEATNILSQKCLHRHGFPVCLICNILCMNIIQRWPAKFGKMSSILQSMLHAKLQCTWLDCYHIWQK